MQRRFDAGMARAEEEEGWLKVNVGGERSIVTVLLQGRSCVCLCVCLSVYVRWTVAGRGEAVGSSLSDRESPEVGCAAQMRFQSQRQRVDSAGGKKSSKRVRADAQASQVSSDGDATG